MRAPSNYRPRIVSLEEAYFTQKDRELIQKLRENQDQQSDSVTLLEEVRSLQTASQESALSEFKKSA